MEWGHVEPLSTDTVKIDREVLPEAILEAALRLRSSIWEPPGEFFTKRGLVSSIR